MKEMQSYVYAGESRGELLQWLNSLLHLGVSRIEQCGTGAIYCQIMDSLYCDVPLKKVNFAARNEYEYVNNYKLLQNAFDAHGVPNYIPVDRLVKCKFQDNMEFLQWLKKYWDAHYTGEPYDAIGRRGGAKSIPSPDGVRKPPMKSSPSSAGLVRPASASNRNSSPRVSVTTAPSTVPALPAKPSATDATLASLRNQLNATTAALSETEQALQLATRERQFYFEKLREIEILVGDEGEPGPGCTMDVTELVKEIRGIMYRTEDGFEIPQDVEEGVGKMTVSEGVAEEVY